MKTPTLTSPRQRFLNWCSSLAVAAISSAGLMPAASHAELIRTEVSAFATSPGGTVHSVAINDAYMAVGNPTDSSNKGAVILYDVASGKKLKTFLGATAGDKFGHAVAMRGNELIVGVPGLDGGKGGVYVYDIVSKRELYQYIGLIGDQLGFSVAADADLIAAGAPTANNGVLGGFDRGYVHVVETELGDWSATRSNNFLPDDPENDAFFGYSVAVLGGNVAVGAPFQNANALNNSGKVYLFDGKNPFGTPTSISDSTPTLNNNFGWAVALTPTHLIASTPYANANSGRVDYYNMRTYSSISSVGIPGALHGSSLAASETHVAVGSPGWSSTGFPGHGMVEIYLEPTDTALIPVLSEYLRPMHLSENGRHGFCVALHGSRIVGGAKDQNLAVLGYNLAATEGIGGADMLRDQFRRGDMLANTSTVGTRTIASFTQAGSTGITPALNGNSSAALGKDRNFGSSVVDGLFATGPAGLNNMSVRSKVSPGGIGGFPILNSITAMSDWVGNSPDYYAVHMTGKRNGLAAGRDLWIFNPSYSYVSQIVAGSSLTDYVLASFGNARHGVYGDPLNNLFVLPSKLRSKTGSAPVTPANDSAVLFFNVAGMPTGGFREGASLSPYGSSYGEFTGRCGFEKNNLAFSAALQGATRNTDSCVVNYHISSFTSTPIAREDEVALGTGGAKFSAFLGETANGFATNGEVVFRASVRGGSPAVTTANNEGLWANRNGASPPDIVFRKGENPGGLFPSGVKISRFVKFWINNYGRIYTLVALTGPGVTKANDLALIESPLSGLPRLHLREGSTAPGLAGGLIGTISRVDARESGNWTALCTIVQKPGTATAANDQALFSHVDSTGILQQGSVILRKGARINRAGSEIIKSINLANKCDDGASGALASGMGHVLSPSRAITTILTYKDGHQSVTEVKP